MEFDEVQFDEVPASLEDLFPLAITIEVTDEVLARWQQQEAAWDAFQKELRSVEIRAWEQEVIRLSATDATIAEDLAMARQYAKPPGEDSWSPDDRLKIVRERYVFLQEKRLFSQER